MKRLAITLLACLVLAMLVNGCDENESQPSFSRVRVSPACGVAPLDVEGYAIASGGNETGDPTGSNNNLEISWNFGDGGTASNTLVYHTYHDPGNYLVRVTATDPDGKAAEDTFRVAVMADSLSVTAMTNFPDGSLTTADMVDFDFRAETCGLNPDILEDYSKLTFHWALFDADSVNFRVKDPSFQFTTLGEHLIRLRVTYPGLSVTRFDSLYLDVTAP